MQIIDNIRDLRCTLEPFVTGTKKIGFVPTMGALHAGHISLIENSIKYCEITVASIYVNPTQFNDKNDLKNYPRNLESDCKMLENAGCNIVFTPLDAEMYPTPDNRVFDFGSMANVMEGKHRPGHFNGVGQIVTKLFDAVKPDFAFFGQKDFQQLAIIRKLVKDFNYPLEIIACPIIREIDGLAMSSRNMLLGTDERDAAPLIYKTIKTAKELASSEELNAIVNYVHDSINISPYLKVEYFEVVNSETLMPVTKITGLEPLTACIAVFSGKIRLIDNIDFIS